MKLKQREARRGLDTAAGTMPRISNHPMLSQGINSLTDAIGDVANHYEAQQQKLQDFKAQQNFVKLGNDLNMSMLDAEQGISEDGSGFSEDRMADFESQSKVFFESLSPEQQAQYGPRLEALRGDHHNKAATKQYNRQNQFYVDGISSTAERLKNGVLANPDSYEDSEQLLAGIVEQTGLPSWQKTKVLKAGRKILREQALNGLAQAGRGEEARALAQQWDAEDTALTQAGVDGIVAKDIPQPAQQLLGTISKPGIEGADYNTLYGGGSFTGFSDHPRQKMVIKSGPNKGKTTTAAGRYQFLAGTWDEAAKALGLADFSPANQDKAAWWLAQRDYKRRSGRDLQVDLENKDYAKVRAGLGGKGNDTTWEGLQKVSDAQFAKEMGEGGQPQKVANAEGKGAVVSSVNGKENPSNFLATSENTQQKTLELSALFGKPLRITPHGGKQADKRKGTSQHPHGNATDLYIDDYSDEEKTQLVALAIANGAKGVGAYSAGDGKGTIHVDYRKGGKNFTDDVKGGIALWHRQKAGVDSSWETGPDWYKEGVKQGVAMLNDGVTSSATAHDAGGNTVMGAVLAQNAANMGQWGQMVEKAIGKATSGQAAASLASYGEYDLALANGETLTTQEINDNPILKDSHKAALIRKVNEANKKTLENNQFMELVKQGQVNPFDVDHQKKTDKLYEAYTANTAGITDPDVEKRKHAALVLGAFVKDTNIVPMKAIENSRLLLVSDDPAMVQEGMWIAGYLATDHEAELKARKGGSDLAKVGREFNYYVNRLGLPPQKAAERYMKRQGSDFQNERERREKMLNGKEGYLASMKDNELADIFDESLIGGDPEVGFTEGQQVSIQADFKDAIKEHYLDTGDWELSKYLAQQDLTGPTGIYGTTEINGTRTLMRFPPEKVYAGYLAKGGNIEDIQSQVLDLIREGAPEGTEPEDIGLYVDARAQEQHKRGKPVYRVVYRSKGKDGEAYMQVTGKYFQFDEAEGLATREEKMRDKVVQDHQEQTSDEISRLAGKPQLTDPKQYKQEVLKQRGGPEKDTKKPNTSARDRHDRRKVQNEKARKNEERRKELRDKENLRREALLKKLREESN